jgi:hypothetical protein
VLVPDPQACGEEAEVGLYDMTLYLSIVEAQANAAAADSDVAKRIFHPLHIAYSIGSFPNFHPHVGACAFLVQPKSSALYGIDTGG